MKGSGTCEEAEVRKGDERMEKLKADVQQGELKWRWGERQDGARERQLQPRASLEASGGCGVDDSGAERAKNGAIAAIER